MGQVVGQFCFDRSTAKIRLFLALGWLLGVTFAGCGPASSPTGPSVEQGAVLEEGKPIPDADAKLTPVEILKRSAEVYSKARTYSDNGELVIHFPKNESPSIFPFAVAMDRGGKKLRVEAYQLTLASDGKRMRGAIEDELSNNLDRQFLDSPAPAKLTPEAAIGDAEAVAILSQGAGGPPPVLEWLLAKKPFEQLLAAPKQLRKLASRELEGRKYYRLQVDIAPADEPKMATSAPAAKGPSGSVANRIVLWVDQDSWLVGRLEYPDIAPKPSGTPDKEDVITVTAELRNAKVDSALESELFVLRPEKDVQVVSFFVPPPPPMPRDRLGKPAPAFTMKEVNGGEFKSDSLAGKVALLLFVRNHPACEEAAIEFQKVQTQFAKDDRFVFRVVANESSEVSDANVSGMFDRWGVSMTALRETGEVSNASFGIENLPTLVVIDESGRLQLSQSFGFSNLASVLPSICEQVAAGEDVAKRMLNVVKEYQERLALAKSGASPPSIQLTSTEIAPKRGPRRMNLTDAWHVGALSNASCLQVVEMGGEKKLAALISPRTLQWLSLKGELGDKVLLDIPEGAQVGIVRSQIDSQMKTSFVAFIPGGEAAYFFDENLKRLGLFPPRGQPHEGVSDVQLADLDAKETAEAYVGFGAFLGVQATNLAGERSWRNLAIPSVISLAAGPKNSLGWQKLYATDDRGRIIMLNQFGNHEVVELADREIHRLVSRHDVSKLEAETAAPGDAIFCGVSFQGKDQLLAIGYDAEFNETWTYKLPSGVFVGPVQYVTSVQKTESNENLWILAGPDGSIHVIGSQGQFEDSFCTGERILGLCALVVEGKPTIVYATASGIHAKFVESPISSMEQ